MMLFINRYRCSKCHTYWVMRCDSTEQEDYCDECNTKNLPYFSNGCDENDSQLLSIRSMNFAILRV